MFKKKDQELLAEAYQVVINEISDEFIQNTIDRRNYAGTRYNLDRASKLQKGVIDRGVAINFIFRRGGSEQLKVVLPIKYEISPNLVDQMINKTNETNIELKGNTIFDEKGNQLTQTRYGTIKLVVLKPGGDMNYIKTSTGSFVLSWQGKEIMFANRAEANKFIQHLQKTAPEFKALRPTDFEIA